MRRPIDLWLKWPTKRVVVGSFSGVDPDGVRTLRGTKILDLFRLDHNYGSGGAIQEMELYWSTKEVNDKDQSPIGHVLTLYRQSDTFPGVWESKMAFGGWEGPLDIDDVYIIVMMLSRALSQEQFWDIKRTPELQSLCALADEVRKEFFRAQKGVYEMARQAILEDVQSANDAG